MKKILLRGSWQTKNIGDIAHTPGFLQLAKEFLPNVEVYLWPCQIDLGVREMLLDNFPNLCIVETQDAIDKAFEECDILVNGSGPAIDIESILKWKNQTGKPYGFYGVSVDLGWSEQRKQILSEAAFVFCRDSLSEYFLKLQKLPCPIIGFAPDSTFALDLKLDLTKNNFLKDNNLEPDKFVCVIPRLRFTPISFDEEHFYFRDTFTEASSMDKLNVDMEKLREVICHIVENHHLKVLICPEMTYQVPMGRSFLYEMLPKEIQKQVVLKDEYWITSEADNVFSQAKMLVSMEMHSPIIFITQNKPAILLRQAEDTWKGQMFRDLGLQDWIFELNISDAQLIKQHVDKILLNYPRALEKAANAKNLAHQLGKQAIENIKVCLQEKNANNQ